MDSNPDLYVENKASCWEYYQGRAAEDILDFSERIRWMGKVLGYLPKEVMDVGANLGTFCDVAVSFGIQPLAVELNLEAVKICKERGIPVWSEAVESMSEKSRFDFIHLSDVIEHIKQPKQLISILTQHCHPGAVFFISTPDFANPLVWPIQYTPQEHISLFTKRSLGILLKSMGFSIIAVRRRSRTRSFGKKSRENSRNSFISPLYRLIDFLSIESFASSCINFILRENLEVIAKWN